MSISAFLSLRSVMANPRSRRGSYIAKGGMAHIYKVRTSRGWRAAKVSQPEKENSEDALLNEAMTMFDLGPHPNIVTLYDIGKIDGRIYLELEYLEPSLFFENCEYLLTENEAINVARGIGTALAHMHGLGYRHGDIKPENIWIGKEAPKLSDLGSVVRMDDKKSRYVAFTNAYLPLRGGRFSAWADIFALGLSLYEMHTGVVPFAFMDEYNWFCLDSDYIKDKNDEWDKVYESFRDQIRHEDFSTRFRSLLLIMTDYKNRALFPDGRMLVKFMDEYFPEL